MTPMAPMKSSTGRPLSGVDVTFLKYSPAVFVDMPAPNVGCATRGPVGVRVSTCAVPHGDAVDHFCPVKFGCG